MSFISRTLQRPFMSIKTALRPSIGQSRCLSASIPRRTDGVYSELTAMRTRTPFIEAFRKEQERKFNAVSSVPSHDVTPDAAPSPSPKSMSDSYHRVLLPLARDPWLLDSYINSSGHIRLGTIFMDLDALAGVVAYKHTGDSVMTVTAAVDRITIKRSLSSICDLEISGQVTFATGRSSMEVSLQVAKAPEDGQVVQEEDVLMTCAFTMVSLDPITKKPVAISPLKAETPEERRLFEQGQANYNLKKALATKGLRKQTPNDEESDLIHALWLQQLDYHNPNTPSRKPPTTLYMDTTSIQSVQIMQPQYRNRHNFMIFGGFLLKSTFELAFTCASAASHSRPAFIALDPSTFENPVPVGSVLYLTATVAYTDSPVVPDPPPSSSSSSSPSSDNDGKAPPTGRTTRIQVRVDSKIRNIEHDVAGSTTQPTGQFNYTFEVRGDLKVVPQTYSQFMVYLDARRRARQGIVAAQEEELQQQGQQGGGAGVVKREDGVMG